MAIHTLRQLFAESKPVCRDMLRDAEHHALWNAVTIAKEGREPELRQLKRSMTKLKDVHERSTFADAGMPAAHRRLGDRRGLCAHRRTGRKRYADRACRRHRRRPLVARNLLRFPGDQLGRAAQPRRRRRIAQLSRTQAPLSALRARHHRAVVRSLRRHVGGALQAPARSHVQGRTRTDAARSISRPPLSIFSSQPAPAVDELLIAIAQDDVEQHGLFEPLLATVHDNLFVASGIRDEDRATSRKPLLLPSKSREPVPHLPEIYLADTPFLKSSRRPSRSMCPTTRASSTPTSSPAPATARRSSSSI